MFFSFRRTRNGEGEWGIVSADTPEQAMSRVLGSHPKKYGVTYAFVFIPDNDDNSDMSLEWDDRN